MNGEEIKRQINDAYYNDDMYSRYDLVEAVEDIVDENAKLREQIHWLKKGDILHVLTDQEYIDQTERERLMQVSIDALDKENAKLRELSSIMLKCIMANERKKLICWECPMHKQFDELRSYCCLEHEAKKLGVEED